MDLSLRLDGYLNQQIAYNNPIPILPAPKIIADKKDTTLLEIAMKAILRQRLSGDLHNFNIENFENKNHLQSRFSLIAKKSRYIQPFYQTPLKSNPGSSKRKYNQSLIEPFYTACNRKSGELNTKAEKQTDPKQKINFLSIKRNSQISSSLDFYHQRNQQRRLSLNNHKKSQLSNQKDENKLDISEGQLNVGTSFISGIDNYQRKNGHNNNKAGDQGIKLPGISDKRKNNPLQRENTKMGRILLKQDKFQLKISDDFWSFISNSKDQKTKKIKQSKFLEDNQSINLSIVANKSPSQTEFTGDGQVKSSLNNHYNQNLILSKERFQNFIGNQKLSIPFLMSSIITFFEISNKITDKMKKNQFEFIFDKLYNQPDIVWSIAVFRFLDANHNATIDSSDLFKAYNTIDHIKTQLQALMNQKLLIKVNKDEESSINSNLFLPSLRPFKREKTISSRNGSSTKRYKKKTSKDSYFSQKTEESQKGSDFGFQTEKNLMRHNFQNVEKLQKQVYKLNQQLISKDSSLKNERDSINYETFASKKESNSQKNKPQKMYLEEALLENKDLKVSELNMIMEELSQQDGNKKKRVVDIDFKKLNIKLSSSYVQTFIAANHNQQTRMNREYLENLKDKIKGRLNGNNQFSQQQQRITLSAIRYSQFYEDKLFLPFKNLFFLSLHAILNINQ